MSKRYALFNPYAGNNCGTERAKGLDKIYPGEEVRYVDMTQEQARAGMMAEITPEDTLILCGGDGTINRFINDLDGAEFPCEVLYYPTGSGNDFAHDVAAKDGEGAIPLVPYLRSLPAVTVQGKKYYFINGVGYGIDGYCCEEGDRQRETSDKPVNYTAIAIKGLLFHYKPTKAKITVDGVSHTYDKVWLAPTMNGRFYGGGMMPTPQQDRETAETLSVMVFHGSGKLKTLTVFPSIFSGTHISHREMVDVLTGREITVEFDRPTPLQIDGETILGVTSYHAVSAARVAEH